MLGVAMKKMLKALLCLASMLVGGLMMTAPARAGLNINAVFPSSYTCLDCGIDPSTVVSLQGDTDAQAAVYAAVNQIASKFDNNLTTNILFYGVHGGNGTILGESEEGGLAIYSYDQYAAALAMDAANNPQNVALNAAVAHLGAGNGAGDPNAYIYPVTTNARILGLNQGVPTPYGTFDSTPEFSATGDFVGGGGFADAVVWLNIDLPLSYYRPVPPVSAGVVWDARRSLEHEIDEALGIGGPASMLNTFYFDPNYVEDFFGIKGTVLGPMDLYRYAAPGIPSFDPTTISITGCGPPVCSGEPSPYFSVDGGVTSIAPFNQSFPLYSGFGDAGDWGVNLSKKCPGGGTSFGEFGDVQDAFICNNRAEDVRQGTPSYLALEAIGYDHPVPEPGTWVIMLLGVAAVGAGARASRVRALA
jgi:hypothetical protein